jgi:hypothetical protein
LEKHLFHLEINRPFGDFQRSMQRSLDLVALGLSALEAQGTMVELPIFPLRYVGSRLPKETLRAEFSPWLIGHGLNDCVEALEPLLLEVWRACQLTRIQPGEVSDEYLLEIQKILEAKKFSHQPVGAKLENFRTEFPEVLSAQGEATLVALNKLRTCLTHAGGIVRQKDCTNDKSLEVGLLWREFVFIDGEGREHAVTKGMVTDSGGYLGIKTSRIPKAVQIGERVNVGPAELMGICETLLEFAVALRQLLIDYLKKHNLVPANFMLDSPKHSVHVELGEPKDQDENPPTAVKTEP